jgi:hypothetical protein
MLDIFLFILTTVTLPMIINKSTESGRLDWIKGYLRQIWTAIFALYSLYLLTRPMAMETIMDWHKRTNQHSLIVYIIVALIGASILCIYWAIAGKIFSEVEQTKINPDEYRFELAILNADWHPWPGEENKSTGLLLTVKLINQGKASGIHKVFAYVQPPGMERIQGGGFDLPNELRLINGNNIKHIQGKRDLFRFMAKDDNSIQSGAVMHERYLWYKFRNIKDKLSLPGTKIMLTLQDSSDKGNTWSSPPYPGYSPINPNPTPQRLIYWEKAIEK